MREYGVVVCFVCLEDQTLAKKTTQFQNLFFCAIRPHFINNSIHFGYIFVMIEHALCRFSHSYMDPSFSLIILHSAS